MFRYFPTMPKTLKLPKIMRLMQSIAKQNIPHKSSFNIVSKIDAANYLACFPKIVNDVVDQQLVSNVLEVNERIKKVLNFNVPYGSHVTPHLMIYSYKFLEKDHKKFVPDKLNLAFRMAWCLDIVSLAQLIYFKDFKMNSASLMIDDIIDDSEMRRGRKTWYKLEGPQAILDSLLLQACHLRLLEKYFSDKGYYHGVLETFARAEIDATVGETLQFEVREIESFTIENFRKIAQYKTTPIRFYAPLKLACLLSNQDINLEDSRCEAILQELGVLYQIQNDFYDCYGEELIGKIGNDIQENICTILIATALEKGNHDQKRTLVECYGHYDAEKVRKVKAVYSELQLENQYIHFEDKSRENICMNLTKIEDNFTRNLLKHYASLIFGRYKNEILNS